MKNNKTSNNEDRRGRLIGALLFPVILVVLFLTIYGLGTEFHFITPMKTWKPTIQIWMADRTTAEGDSVYLACLNQKADILERKDYNEKALATRKEILDYYVGKGDVESVDYAVAKIKYLNCDGGYKKHCEEARGAKEILWNAWKRGLLGDEEKMLLIHSIMMLTNDKSILDSKQEFIDALAVADDISNAIIRTEYQNISLNVLVGICSSDISTITEAQKYVDRLDPSSMEGDFIRTVSWITKSRYQLCMHNISIAQQYLNNAKAVDCREFEMIKSITDLQYSIYKASGDLEKASEERKHLIALEYGIDNGSKMYRTLVRLENAIQNGHKWLAKWYIADLKTKLSDYEDYIDSHPESHAAIQHILYDKIKFSCQLQMVEYSLKFNTAVRHVHSVLNDMESEPYLSDEVRLKLIEYHIKAAVQYPTDSTNKILNRCVNQLQKRLQCVFPHFTDGEKAAFWSAEEPIMRQVYAAKSSAGVKYNVALLSKGLLLTSSSNIRRSVLESGDSILIEDWKKLLFLRQVAYLGLKLEDIDAFAIQDGIDSLERSIVSRSNDYQHYMNTWDMSWNDVQKQLNDDDCAIEIICYPKNNDIQYDALILRKSDKAPVCVHIGRESFLTKESSSILYKKKSLFVEAFLKPISPYLTSGNIFISMDGIFHYKNIEAMVADDEGNLLSDLYSIVRVSSTRDISGYEVKPYVSASLFGGIEYDITEKERINNAKQYGIARENTPRGLMLPGKKDKTIRFKYLPYSLAEVKSINDILSSQGCDIYLYIKKMACEDAFKNMSGKSKQIIHISTHGLIGDVSDSAVDPMRKCCLLLSGANNGFNSKNIDKDRNYQDGILTAAEIASLDLRGTDLVVLSACNTGKGKITSDGVFGLQRAFKQAGVKSIIMSLRSVSDMMTARFMTDFYRHLAADNDVRMAFSAARDDMRRKYPDSLDWAAFILLD